MNTLKRKFLICVILFSVTVIALYVAFYPKATAPVRPVPSEKHGDNDPYTANNLLSSVELLIQGVGYGPDDVAMGHDGHFYTGLQDGRIIKFTSDGSNSETFVNTGGRPLGLEFDSKGNLIVADANKGLLSISPDKTISILTDSVSGEKIFCPEDLDIAKDGTIWFSDALQGHKKIDLYHDVDFTEYRGLGRILSFNPETKETKVHFSNLMITKGIPWAGPINASGITLGPDETFILVNEWEGPQISRLWLKGPKAGQRDIFLPNLPGLPSGISFNGKDVFWVTFSTPHSSVIGVSPDGEVVHNFQDQDRVLDLISSANEYNGRLYLGSNVMSAVGRFELP